MKQLLLYAYLLVAMHIAASFGWGFGIWSAKHDPWVQRLAPEHFQTAKLIAYFIFLVILLCGFILLNIWVQGIK